MFASEAEAISFASTFGYLVVYISTNNQYQNQNKKH